MPYPIKASNVHSCWLKSIVSSYFLWFCYPVLFMIPCKYVYSSRPGKSAAFINLYSSNSGLCARRSDVAFNGWVQLFVIQSYWLQVQTGLGDVSWTDWKLHYCVSVLLSVFMLPCEIRFAVFILSPSQRFTSGSGHIKDSQMYLRFRSFGRHLGREVERSQWGFDLEHASWHSWGCQ